MVPTNRMIRNARVENYPGLFPKIEKIQFYCGRWQRHAILEPAAIRNLRRLTIASSAGSSTRIEGGLLNDQQASEVIKSGKVIYEERSAGEVLGYAEALATAFRHKPAQNSILSHGFICQLHRKLMHYEPIGLVGRYRLNEVNVSDGRGGILLVCALPDLVPGFTKTAISDICRKWNDPGASRLLAIAEFIAEFLAIHPFEDGNGRCARLLTVFLLRKAGHEYLEYTSLERQIEKGKIAYYLTLNEAQKTGKLDRWIHFFLDTLLAAQVDLEKRLRPFLSKTGTGRSPLQKEVLDLFRTQGTLKAGEIGRHTGKSAAGIRKVLASLVKARIIKPIGRNRGRYYRLARPG